MSRVDRTHLQVLHLLKEKQGNFVSGTSVASRLRMSRTSVWKHIQNLRSLGYDIISHPKEGYNLREIPDLLIPEEIVPYLETAWLARTYRHYRQIG